jgi:hypothetical protein
LEEKERLNIAIVDAWTKNEICCKHFDQLHNKKKEVGKKIAMRHCYSQQKINNRRHKEIEVYKIDIG